MTDRYVFWRDSLAGLKPQITNEHPMPGFYRMKRGTGWVPVAVWPLGPSAGMASLGFKIGHEKVGADIGTERWPWYAAHPITEDVYRAVAERGEQWPDEDATVAAILATNHVPAATQAAPDATKSPADPVDEMREQIAVALRGVPTYAKIESEDANAAATGLRNLLNELAGDADKARVAEKEPFLEGGRKVDAKYKKLIDSAKAGALEIKKARDVYEDMKREAARQAALRAAEEQRRIDEEAAHRDISEPIPVVQSKSNLPPPAAQIRPTYGRAANVGTKMVVTAVDWDKMIAALKPRPEWPIVEDFLREMAQKLANKGIVLDGVTTREAADTK